MKSNGKSFSESFTCTVAATKVTVTGTTFTKRAPDGELLNFAKWVSWCTGMLDCGTIRRAYSARP